MKLKDLVDIQTGEIVTRIEKRGTVGEIGDYRLYERASFSKDFGMATETTKVRYLVPDSENKNLRIVHPGSGIISIMTGEMAVTSGFDEAGKEMILTSNYAEVTNLQSDLVDMNYLSYWFNYDDEALRQIQLANEVSTTAIKRLNVSQLKELEITLPKFELQKEIGAMYKASRERNLAAQKRLDIQQQIELGEIQKLNVLAKEAN
ncbi:restriction endonuclease subunit S [Weissella confusa]|uniref:restriction endonuclease subunit S n=1 Tax=Weissella confusa TaxID=1583 RepID=UPI0018F1FF82|nr:restriction endonuclease subunit S [Weissella confusa]MBJ7648364.1 restriction endonuclease subunit S [Weissella confusa]MBJ7680884.1 restriction endonuclease subunit S [Weissella confusa]